MIAAPADIDRIVDGGTCGAVVTYDAPANDNCPGVGVVYSRLPGSAFPLGTTTVECTATDAAGNSSSCSFHVTVRNPAPAPMIEGRASAAPVAVGTPVAFRGSFTDNAGDAHTAQWLLDGAAIPAAVDEAARAVSGTHTFAAPGVYSVELPVTDQCGGSGTAREIDDVDEMVVVFDPREGFIAGGGWIDSPAGAWTANPSMAGAASLGFVSKYRKAGGAGEFQFRVGSLRFHSVAYEGFAVSDAMTQYHGSGTINGAGSYGFLLTAVDGQMSDEAGTDRFRIQITDKISDEVIYDSQPGAADSATTPLRGGSIEIHPSGGIAAARATGDDASVAAAIQSPTPIEYAFAPNFPNPFKGSTRLRFDLPEASFVSLTVHDMLGRQVAGVVRGQMPAGRHEVVWQTRDGSGGPVSAGVYFVHMKAASISSGKAFVRMRKLVVLP